MTKDCEECEISVIYVKFQACKNSKQEVNSKVSAYGKVRGSECDICSRSLLVITAIITVFYFFFCCSSLFV